MLLQVDCVLGCGRGHLAFSMGQLGHWGDVVYAGDTAELATAAAAAEVRGLSSVASLAVGEVGV